MARPAGVFRMEAAGSLTPELEGAFKSITHSRRSGKPNSEKTVSAGRHDHGRR
ncbi:MAG: hypothetical protein VB096_01770 [Pseudoflavonifractor sp.]|nr:hypothetical protein [Pseudoflavonifractor sp.]